MIQLETNNQKLFDWKQNNLIRNEKRFDLIQKII